jgi:tetratricopeptide (TPR) repeat protein
MITTRIALAMIVKGTDDEAELLDRCLGNIGPYVDGIYITRTHLPGEKPNEAVAKVAASHMAVLSDFEWTYDFSAARNFNFNQVPRVAPGKSGYDYILWSDTDDLWRGMGMLHDTVDDNPNVDGFGMLYLYDWDEFKRPIVVHRKTMLVKNNGCVEWKGRIHEDLTELRQLDIKLIDGIQRCHVTTEKRSNDSALRNLDISERALLENPDDPRHQWDLANAQMQLTRYDEALKQFEKFISNSNSDDEKYLAFQRLSAVYHSKNDTASAIRNLQIAIGLCPSLPEAYFQLSNLYFMIGDMDKAETYCLTGLQRRPQPHKMIVYNPRDYDYNPMMLLAKIYYHKSRPDLMLPMLKGCLKIYPKDEALKKMVREGTHDKRMLGNALKKIEVLRKIKSKKRLKEELDALPLNMRSHPAICVIRNTKFVKETSTGKDLVYYAGQTDQAWNGETFKKEGVGGSEEAVIHLSEEWAAKGWNVVVYNNCGHKEVVSNGVIYKPWWAYNYRDKQDVTILWRSAKPLDAPINSGLIFLDLHDVIAPGELTPERLAKVTKVLVKTKFHRSLFPLVPDNKIIVIPNGFQDYEFEGQKDPMLIINTSSPDRSLDVLPKLFMEVKKQVPEAKLEWAYGWNNYIKSNASDVKMMQWMTDTNAAMDAAGIVSHGRLTQQQVGELYQRANILAYPSEFAEIFCISVLKAQSAGCMPITTDFGAFAEINHFGVKIHSEKTNENWSAPYQFHFGLENEEGQRAWVAATVEQLKHPKKMVGVPEWVEQFKWVNVAEDWNKLF